MRSCVLVLLAVSIVAAPRASHAGVFEDAVLEELNYVRANPRAYAEELGRGEGLLDISIRRGPDDPEALREAVAFLMRQAPAPPLTADGRLADVARDHAEAQGPTGEVGHGAPGSLGPRLRSRGVFAGLGAESISYGQRTPAEVVRQLIIDSGVPGRGHRRDVMGRAFQAAGVSCGPHARWGSMCVIEYAGSIVER